MCGKATLQPGGVSGAGGAEGRIWRAFVSRHKQKISQGWWAPLDAEAQVQHNANERVPLWPSFAATDSRARGQRQVVRGRQMDTNCREDLRSGRVLEVFTVRKVAPVHTRTHKEAGALPQYK